MRTKMLRNFTVFAVLFVCTVAGLAAETRITLSNIKGKVEIKPLNATWTPAQEGMTITTLTTVSTGFDSSVTVKMDKNTLYVKPLTRMTVDKLVESQGTVSTSCYLRVGGVSASIKSAEGVKQDFKVQSPYSTASVRGTEFDYDGLKLNVSDGVVALIPGRPVRDMQAPAGAETSELPDQEDDFVGSSDTPTADGTEVLVPKGASAVLSIDNGSTFNTKRSEDRNSLETSTTVPLTNSGTGVVDDKAPGDTRRKGVKYGSVTVTVTVPSETK